MASIPGYDQEVPLLIVSWHFSVKPSNIIMLESSIAITVDKSENSNSADDNIHCFDLVSRKDYNHGPSSHDSSPKNKLSNGKLTRTFSAPLEERDEWVRKINETIDLYEKSRRKSIRHHDERLLPPTSPLRRSPSGRTRNIDLSLSGLSIAC